jgi:hypothetical protein
MHRLSLTAKSYLAQNDNHAKAGKNIHNYLKKYVNTFFQLPVYVEPDFVQILQPKQTE